MARTAPEGSPRITPYLLYEDCAAAIDWLSEAFGFHEVLQITGDEGAVTHAELRLKEDVVYIGHPGPDYRSPNRSGTRTSLTYVYVDDVDAHCARARAAGATVIAEPHEPGTATVATTPRTWRGSSGRSRRGCRIRLARNGARPPPSSDWTRGPLRSLYAVTPARAPQSHCPGSGGP